MIRNTQKITNELCGSEQVLVFLPQTDEELETIQERLFGLGCAWQRDDGTFAPEITQTYSPFLFVKEGVIYTKFTDELLSDKTLLCLPNDFDAEPAPDTMPSNPLEKNVGKITRELCHAGEKELLFFPRDDDDSQAIQEKLLKLGCTWTGGSTKTSEDIERAISVFAGKMYSGVTPDDMFHGSLVCSVDEFDEAELEQTNEAMPDGAPEEEAERLINEPALQKVIDKIDALIGMDDAKRELREIIALARFDIMKRKLGLGRGEPPCYHMVYTGNPGTGKTTFARLAAEAFQALGIIASNNVHEVTRKDLIGMYSGQTEKNTDQAISKARNGVLFIDEAYALTPLKGASDGDGDYGYRVVDTLVPALENMRRELIVIFAGYKDRMDYFLEANPGIASRCPIRVHFDNYDMPDLGRIMDGMLRQRGYTMTEQAREEALKQLQDTKYADLDNFGNGRDVRNLIEEIERAHALRVGSTDTFQKALKMDKKEKEEFLMTFTHEDVKRHEEEKKREKIPSRIDEDKLAKVMAEIDAMTGLGEAKDELNKAIAMARFNIMKEEAGIFTEGAPCYHMVFTGNPGTGKTTFARLTARAFHALGILRTDHLHEVTREDLVGSFLGQSEKNTAEHIEKARNGVLFIDEAYTLNPTQSAASGEDYGSRVIDTLVPAMENLREEMVVIMAGYKEPMEQFLAANPGLASRCPLNISFNDFTTESLGEILDIMMLEKSYTLEPDARAEFLKRLEEQKASDGEVFGNGRAVRNMIEDVERVHACRIQKEKIGGAFEELALHETRKKLTTISLADITGEGIDLHDMVAVAPTEPAKKKKRPPRAAAAPGVMATA